ncbi:MAG TPA: BTAD domain-containing putative transcriptional regulator, partial [Caldilineaceae bacterium]|nr:BTAD domain-containing putative transcriptional regulator [Caldilineaceae bacterium]
DYAQSAKLYQGEFLTDFLLPDSEAWEQWAERLREAYRQQAHQAYLQWAAALEVGGQWSDALAVTRRLLTHAPWHEEAHCTLMRLLARSGQRSAALAHYDTLTQILLDELGVPPAATTDALYDQILAGAFTADANRPDDAKATPLAGSLNQPLEPPYQPPAPPPHFVGREAEVAQLCRGLTKDDAPVWALVGMGGSGKSALALQVAHQLRTHFVDGVLWANAKTSHPLDILNGWGKAYGYDFSGLPDLESRAAAVRGLLAARTVFLILDDVDTSTTLRLLLPDSDNCRILLTTRNLDVAHALNATVLPLGELAPTAGRALLAAILGEERIAAEEIAATAICRQLHNLPLALEIVAQRLRTRSRVSLAAMADRLGEEDQRRGLAISDRAVRTSFMVSWDELTSPLQQLFAALGVFAGRPFTAAAVAHIVARDPFDADDQLYGLVALSLLQEEGEMYFRQHPLLADFAQEQLGAAQGPLQRMVDYYAQFAGEHTCDYAQLENEWGNLFHAIETAHKRHLWPQVITITEYLADAWMTRSRFDEAKQSYAFAVNAAQAQRDDRAHARTLLRWAKILIEQSNYTEAKTLLAEALPLYTGMGDQQQLAAIHYHLGSIAHEQGDLAAAMEFAQRAHQLYAMAADQAGIATAEFLQAYIHYDQEAFSQAEALGEQARQRQLACGDQTALIATLRLLATIQIRYEAYAPALTYIHQALTLSEALQNRHESATNHYTIAAIYIRLRDFDQALAHGTKALSQFQQLGLRRLEGMMHYQLGTLHKELEEYSPAAEHAQQSVAIFQALGDAAGAAYADIVMGDVYAHLGEDAHARTHWRQAAAVGQRLGNSWLQAETTKRLKVIPKK